MKKTQGTRAPNYSRTGRDAVARGGAAWLPPYCGERGSRTDLAKTRRVPRFRLHEGSEMNLPKLLHVLQQFKGANPLFVTPGW